MKLRLWENSSCQASVNKSLQMCFAYSHARLSLYTCFLWFSLIHSLEYSREREFIQDFLRYGMSFKQKYSEHVKVVLLWVKPIYLMATMRVANRKQFEMQKNSPQTSRNCFYSFKFKIGLSLNCPKLTLHTLTKIVSGIPDDYEERLGSISTFYTHKQHFLSNSVFYPDFSVLSPFQRFISISAFYPHFSFRFQFPFQPFSFSVLFRLLITFAILKNPFANPLKKVANLLMEFAMFLS